MPRHARQAAESGIYHVMLRGVNRDAIFRQEEDCRRFLYALSQTREASGCQVFAFCLMPNHVHLVLRTADEPLGLLMKRLGVRYAGWFNRKYGRVGHLFQDRFKSVPVETDEHLVVLLRYVWDNPVQAGLTDRCEEYRWSSRRYFGREPAFLDHEELQSLFAEDVRSAVRRAGASYDPESPPRMGPAPQHTQAEAAELLRAICGVADPASFLRLERQTQNQAIRDLRARSLAYALIAKATGLSEPTVRRRHASPTAVVR